MGTSPHSITHQYLRGLKMPTPITFEQAIDEVVTEIRNELSSPEKVEKLLEEMKQVLIEKQFDYGHGNILKFGEFGVLVRVSDKIERLKTLLENNATPKNESIYDSWKDLSNYGIIALLLRRKTFTLPLECNLTESK